ncbi:MAG: phosphoribosylglycinamide formyltransferase [Fimbriimonadaceae bacterium]|nr:phosphoribosylglycinamide formyltransferase [Fimbriimonadaceae bacterium]QYK58105.1 MAG: phosphoribosylglycinamide formyltransferase [Fimbriimonadaceae bacterium]
MGQKVRARVAVLVGSKGRGSNMEALVRASAECGASYEVALVVSTSSLSPALERARDLGIPTLTVAYGPDFGANLIKSLRSVDAKWLCLAGFMNLVPRSVLDAYPNRILNIHPSLLPKFGGKGLYGSRVHQAVIDAGETESGCTVHYVSERYDEGEVIVQRKCEVRQDDTVESLASRVLALEHQAYAEALNQVVGQ